MTRVRSSGRVRIRRFAPTDLPDLLAYHAHPVVRAHQRGAPMSEAEAARFVAVQATQQGQERDAWHGRVVEHVLDHRVIGDLGIWLPSEGVGPVVGDLGFQFDPRYHGLGYAEEALQAFLPDAFRTFALDHVTASCDAANTSSWGLMERLGMQLVQESEGERRYGTTRERWAREIGPAD